MERINYHHLMYFWLVAREGSLTAAAAKLRLAHPTLSSQVRSLEESLGEKLFERQGRRLVLTEMGRIVHGYAEEIFALGTEMLDTVRGQPTGSAPRLVVGIAEVMPKLVAKLLLDPARSHSIKARIVCREDKTERLLSELGAHSIDVVLSDRPAPAGGTLRVFNHLLGECGITIFARKALAAKYRPDFPRSLHKAPLLMPTDSTSLRRAMDQWFESNGLRPRIEGEFDDLALMKAFGQDGRELFPSPSVIESAVKRQHEVEVDGRLPDVRERFYAISAERRIRNPAVIAICEKARNDLFG